MVLQAFRRTAQNQPFCRPDQHGLTYAHISYPVHSKQRVGAVKQRVYSVDRLPIISWPCRRTRVLLVWVLLEQALVLQVLPVLLEVVQGLLVRLLLLLLLFWLL